MKFVKDDTVTSQRSRGKWKRKIKREEEEEEGCGKRKTKSGFAMDGILVGQRGRER